MAIATSEEVRSLAKQRLRQQQPEFDESALRRALIEELYGIRLGLRTTQDIDIVIDPKLGSLSEASGPVRGAVGDGWIYGAQTL